MMLFQRIDQLKQGPRLQFRVWIEQKVVAWRVRFGRRHPLVIGCTKAGVILVNNEMDVGKKGLYQIGRAVGGGVVYHPHLTAQSGTLQIGKHRAQALHQVIPHVPTDDNNRYINHKKPEWGADLRR